MAKAPKQSGLQARYDQRLEGYWRQAPFVLRITEWKDYPPPVLVIKERLAPDDDNGARSHLVERGCLWGESQRRCLALLRQLLEPVCDDGGIPLELHRFLTRDGLKLRVNLPLDEEAGAKVALLFRLQERLTDLDRVELIGRRIAHFSREEAAYWLSRTTRFGADANRWAVAGLRILLGGQPNDQGVQRMLGRLR